MLNNSAFLVAYIIAFTFIREEGVPLRDDSALALDAARRADPEVCNILGTLKSATLGELCALAIAWSEIEDGELSDSSRDVLTRCYVNQIAKSWSAYSSAIDAAFHDIFHRCEEIYA